jgi:hypothetical protein
VPQDWLDKLVSLDSRATRASQAQPGPVVRRVNPVQQVPLAIQVSRVPPVYLDTPELPVRRVMWDKLETLDLGEQQEQLVVRDLQEVPDSQVLRVSLVHMVSQGRRELLDHPGNPDYLDLLEQLVALVIQVLLGWLGNRVQPDLVVPLETREHLAVSALPVRLVCPEAQEIRDLQDSLARPEVLDLSAPAVQKVPPALLARPVRWAASVRQVTLDHRAAPVTRVHRVCRVRRVRRAPWLPAEMPETRVTPEHPETLDPLVNQVPLEAVDHRDRMDSRVRRDRQDLLDFLELVERLAWPVYRVKRDLLVIRD